MFAWLPHRRLIAARRVTRLVAFALLLVLPPGASACRAQVSSGNLIQNPGAESGDLPWGLDSFGPTLVQNGPLSLSNGVAIVATEGSHFFGADVIYSDDEGFLNSGTASIRQTIDVRPFPSITSMTLGMDAMAAGETLSGDGVANVRADAVVFFLDESLNSLETQFVSFPPYGGDFKVDSIAIGLRGLRKAVTVTPPQATVYARVEFTMATGLTEPTMLSEVRVLAGIDNAYFSVEYAPTVPGDYNLSGFVDGADLDVWQAAFGQVGAGLAADGDMNDAVDGADFLLWQRHVVEGLDPCPGGGACVVAVVPEPTALFLAFTAIACLAVGVKAPQCG